MRYIDLDDHDRRGVVLADHDAQAVRQLPVDDRNRESLRWTTAVAAAAGAASAAETDAAIADRQTASTAIAHEDVNLPIRVLDGEFRAA